jgi:hypothetical protein
MWYIFSYAFEMLCSIFCALGYFSRKENTICRFVALDDVGADYNFFVE